MKNNTLQRLKYIFWDTVAACGSYTLLYVFRRVVIESDRYEVNELTFGPTYYMGLVLTPLFWVTIYFITAFYRDIYRRSRLKELIYTFNASLLGSIFIFFALILDDWVVNYTDYYRGFLVYFGSHFFLTGFFRFLISS